jgi:hypothetical protein
MPESNLLLVKLFFSRRFLRQRPSLRRPLAHGTKKHNNLPCPPPFFPPALDNLARIFINNKNYNEMYGGKEGWGPLP